MLAPDVHPPRHHPRRRGTGHGRSSWGTRPHTGKRWQPRPGAARQWQLSGRLDTSVDVPVYDTGAWEGFRPDAGKFPKSALGKGNGWKGERRLDIRLVAKLAHARGMAVGLKNDLKAVFHVEYELPTTKFCANSRRLKLSSLNMPEGSQPGGAGL
ncbi:hypothetical protein [Streptomyces sp. NPDC088350]|uniref:hypothetical protein n=1 Tax=Streptomyces sp. NPDC088350 TaxID=3365854 RepID=UPI00381B42FF